VFIVTEQMHWYIMQGSKNTSFFKFFGKVVSIFINFNNVLRINMVSEFNRRTHMRARSEFFVINVSDFYSSLYKTLIFFTLLVFFLKKQELFPTKSCQRNSCKPSSVPPQRTS